MVRKADGSQEPLDFNKIKRALERAGASKSLCEEVVESLHEEINEGISTKKIYRLAFMKLKEFRPGAAARFGLKNSLFKFGPEGYPFETFMGALLRGRGYETQVRQIVQGKCISHEIDVVATRPKFQGHARTKSIIECKFHNSPSIRCSIQSALYSWARFLDIRERDISIDSCWLATNTKFSSDVIQYGDCVGLKLLGWSFPRHESIQVRIEENKLYPITVIHKISKHEFYALHEAGVITLKDLIACPQDELKKAGLRENKIERLKEKAREIMARK